MKKLFTLALAVILIVSSLGTTYALESGVTSFSITPIKANQKDKFVYVTINAPKTQDNSKLLVGFYTDGVLTRLTPYDISAKTQFTKQKINAYILVKDPEGNYYLDQTPDEIKIFTWDQTSLKPKTLCDNVLTDSVIDDANAEVLKSLAIVPQATEFIRKNRLISEESYNNGEFTEWDKNIAPILDYIDICAIKAVEDARGHLLTSLYAQSLYKDDIDQIQHYANQASAREKNKLKALLSVNDQEMPEDDDQWLNGIGIKKEYYDALQNATKFLDFSLTDK